MAVASSFIYQILTNSYSSCVGHSIHIIFIIHSYSETPQIRVRRLISFKSSINCFIKTSVLLRFASVSHVVPSPKHKILLPHLFIRRVRFVLIINNVLLSIILSRKDTSFRRISNYWKKWLKHRSPVIIIRRSLIIIEENHQLYENFYWKYSIDAQNYKESIKRS